ncbi:carbohydrate ABC transporter permease [Occultella gossypii]|uniref:carbohydrate ABC transporter permease n=1 Tax=Occultella gossypii TaxID=2800820 RepID=UPI001CBD38C0|nr:carbohydrate ABC transporter permease [Occultella gossypii]
MALVAMIYPLLWMIRLSFLPESEVANAGLWPEGIWTGINYTEGWSTLSVDFTTFFLNSAVVAILALIGNLLACSLSAYVLARLRFRLQPVYFGVVIATLLIPVHVLLIPQYLTFSYIGALNTFIPLVLPKFLATDAFFVFLMIQFVRGIPRELDQAAFMDGAGYFRIYWSIILPLMRPALATTAIFTVIWTWNDFLGPLIYLTRTSLYTVPVALNALLSTDTGFGTGRLLAMSVLSLVPLVIFFFVAQKQILEGISSSGLK